MAELTGPAKAVEARIRHQKGTDGTLVIAISGELDVSNVAKVQTIIGGLLTPAPSAIVFDLYSLKFMDSSGIATLLQVAEPFGSVEIHHASAIIERIIAATGVADILRVRS